MQNLALIDVERCLVLASGFENRSTHTVVDPDGKKNELFEIFHSYIDPTGPLRSILANATTKCCASGTCEIAPHMC